MDEQTPYPFDMNVASPARMYDYWLGGKDNFAADRRAAEEVLAAHPAQPQLVQANRDFLVRAVRYLAEEGIDQFLDLGAGIPTSPNVHEVARSVRPDARIVYVDNDPIVFAHSRVLRATEAGIACVQADVGRPEDFLADPAVTEMIDFGRPVGLLAIAIFHFVPNAEAVMDALRQVLCPGSFVAMSTGTTEGLTAAQVEAIKDAYSKSTVPAMIRSRPEIEKLLDGFDLVEPGLVHVAKWRSDALETPGRLLAGVGRLGDR